MIRVSASASGLLELSGGSPRERQELRAEFERRNCVRVPDFLAPDLLEEVLERVNQSGFYSRDHGDIGTEECAEAGPGLALLLLAANDPRLFELVREITGCGEIGCFDGRVYRIDPARGHHDSWHSDVGDNRLVAMSLNLSTEPYEGGVLEIRDQRTGEITARPAGLAPGEVVMFRIAEHLRHRVSPVIGDVPRLAFAGWFKSAPSFRSVLAGGSWAAELPEGAAPAVSN
jgi:2OG-Fe(II) oxygenase superfamily